MQNKAAISAKELTKHFGSRKAVQHVSFDIKQGEIFSLLGTNGAGKTTTIKMLCCLLKPTSGNAQIMGNPINQGTMKIKRIIGVSPQETAIAGHLNTRENLILMGGVHGLSQKESKKKAHQLMDLMELEDRRDQARKLSGGLQRRLSIAMALMSDPQILFLDEPTLGLDPHARKSVWNYIEKLKGEKTILLTTHYLEEADSLADRIAIMNKSKIIEMGTSSELKKKYNTRQTLNIKTNNITTKEIEMLQQKGMDVLQTPSGIEITGNNPDFYTLVDILRSGNVKIEAIHMPEPTLDDVFIQLTGKEAQP
ncbi:MAG: ATP-binding cassette domain-containing protein [Prolixibacteraceae bacterium]|nr:ATP-binding cassette domain-containing protein [Prolixibacteraceae bacterium]